MIYLIDGIKVDFVDYNFELIEPINVVDGIRLVSKKDIAAMKLNAIAGRGSKKDFVDVYQLLNEFSLIEMLSLYIQKYPNGSEFMVLKSLLYFDDADNEPNPIMLLPVSWEQIKEKISLEVEKLYVKMQYIILKKELSQSKLDALFSFLKGLGVDAEVKSKTVDTVINDSSEFTLNSGIWKDNPITSEELRRNGVMSAVKK